MLYLVAVILPPLAVLLAGKPFQALLSIPLTLLFYLPASFMPCSSFTITTPTGGRTASSGP